MSATASATASAAPSADFSPSQILHALMLSYLYPLFRNPHTGNVDPAMAHGAAIETLKTFRVRDTWELFTCTQIMSFGLAALGSIGLSMTEGLSPAMVLRCRGNANGLHRASQQSRRMLDDYRAAAEARRAHEAALARAPIPDLAGAQAEAAAQVAETERLLAVARSGARGAAEAAAPVENPAPAATPTAPVATSAAPAVPFCTTYRAAALASTASGPAAPPLRPDAADLPPMPPMTPGMTEQQHQRVWANAMLTVAKELTAELTLVSPEERRLHAIRISALTTVANNLLNGRKPTPLPPLMVPRSSPK